MNLTVYLFMWLTLGILIGIATDVGAGIIIFLVGWSYTIVVENQMYIIKRLNFIKSKVDGRKK